MRDPFFFFEKSTVAIHGLETFLFHRRRDGYLFSETTFRDADLPGHLAAS